MRGLIFTSAIAVAVAVLAVPVQAQQDAGVGTYLCTFAGKCDQAAQGDDPVVKAAPTTKGFRLAGPQNATTPAPSTKGFRFAQPQASSTTAPAVKGFRFNRTTPTAARPARVASRPAYVAARPAPVAPGAGTRANLMLGFGYNSDQMTPAAEAKARGFAKALLMPELSAKRFMIEGHTDARGGRDLNVDLSRRRAQSVADFLVAQGIDRSRVEVKGVGPDEPLPGRSRNAEANRRVEAVLLG